MTRGRERAPSQNAYRGAAGTTRTRSLHVTLPSGDVITTQAFDVVDAVADPELGQRMLSTEPGAAINRVRTPDGAELTLAIPIVYHDPASEVFALVASATDRHRELELRSQVLAELARDPSAAVPAYVRDFVVVFGAAGLAHYLEQRVEAALAAQRAGDSVRAVERERAAVDRDRIAVDADRAAAEQRRAELATREVEVDRRAAALAARERALDDRDRDLAHRSAELATATADAARRLADAERARRPTPGDAAIRVIAEAGRSARSSGGGAPVAGDPVAGAPVVGAPVVGEPVTRPVRSLTEVPDEVTSPYELLAEADAPELPASVDPITTLTAESPQLRADPRGTDARAVDPWVAGFARGTAPAIYAVDDGRARVAIRATAASAPALVASPLDVRIVLHRRPEYPVIALVIGTPAALRGFGPPHHVMIALDVAGEPDRRFLAQLERDFTIEVDVVAEHRPTRRARLKAPLGENVGFIVRAASDHLRGLPSGDASLARGLATLGGPTFDLLGANHPEHAEFRVDKLEPLTTANQVRRALAIARRFSKPQREDYLACVRSFPLPRWRELRHTVVARAVELGLWMGPDLAQAAVSEGLARSRKLLIGKLEAAFAGLLGDAARNDLDPDAIEDNRKALLEEAQTLGMTSAHADAEPPAVAASGTIAPRPSAPTSVRGRPVAELVALLDDRDRRLGAALELCERGDPSAVRPVMNAARRMSRADAVRVLGAMVRLGPAAAPALTAGLASSKAFLRHGCALALALLRTEEGTEAVVDVLLSEPTEIWREIARAVGHVGPAALMPLAARLGRLGDRASVGDRERIAWAMAHVGVRGGKTAVETLAAGHSAVAPVARMALERIEPAARDDVSGKLPVREVTVNRAFSRRFFEALERGLPDLGKEELDALDRSSPMELLDEGDLLIDDGDGDVDGELDESDLLDD